MANFFELLGFSSDEMADTMPEKIVQAFHDNGKDGVRVLMYEEIAKRLSAPLHIHCSYADGTLSTVPDVYGRDQPGEPIKLIREPTDLYRRYGEPPSPGHGSPDAPAAAGAARKRSSAPRGGGGGGGAGAGAGAIGPDGKATGPDAWERRFSDLAEFVNRNGFRPRRTAPEDSERHLHYWMGQQQRKLGHNELSRDQAERLEALLLSTKGRKAEGSTARRSGGAGRKASTAQASEASAPAYGDDDAEGDEQDYGDDGDYA